MLSFPKPKSRPKRPRPGRLTGDPLAALRAQVFERDNYRCQHVIDAGESDIFNVRMRFRCYKRITWDTGHMAHIKSRGAGGTDTLDNVVTKCAECHIGREHTKGEK